MVSKREHQSRRSLLMWNVHLQLAVCLGPGFAACVWAELAIYKYSQARKDKLQGTEQVCLSYGSSSYPDDKN